MKKILVVCFIVLLLNNPVFADDLEEPPELPDNIYGDIYVNDELAEIDTVVYAKVGTSNNSIEYVITKTGKFGDPEDPNKRFLVFGTILDVGEVICFYILDNFQNKITAQTTPETIHYQGGENKRVILNFTIEDTNTIAEITDNDTNTTETTDNNLGTTTSSTGGSSGGGSSSDNSGGNGGSTNTTSNKENNTDQNQVNIETTDNEIIEIEANNTTYEIEEKTTTSNNNNYNYEEKEDTNISENNQEETENNVLSNQYDKDNSAKKSNFNIIAIVFIFIVLLVLGAIFAIIKKNKKHK